MEVSGLRESCTTPLSKKRSRVNCKNETRAEREAPRIKYFCMKTYRHSVNDLRRIVTDITVMRDDDLVDKATTMLLALISGEVDTWDQ